MYAIRKKQADVEPIKLNMSCAFLHSLLRQDAFKKGFAAVFRPLEKVQYISSSG